MDCEEVDSVSPNVGPQVKEIVHATPELFMVSPLSGIGVTPDSQQNRCTGDIPPSPDDSEALEKLLQYRSWLRAQILQLQAELTTLKADAYPAVDAIQSQEEVAEWISKLQQELLEKKATQVNRETVIRGIQLKQTATGILNRDSVAGGDTQLVQKKRQVEDLLDQQVQATSDIAKEQQEIDILRDQLLAVRKNNFDLKVRSRQLFQQVKEKKEARENVVANLTQDEKAQRLQDTLEHCLQKATILKHTLQGLVIGSGINWAQDKDMLKLVLSLGSNYVP